MLFIKKIIKNNNISKAYFVCNKLPYSKDYMSFSDEIFYMTILFVKNDENKNYDKYVYTNNKKVKEYLIFSKYENSNFNWLRWNGYKTLQVS